MQSGGLLLDGLRFPDRRQQDVQQAHLGGECEQGRRGVPGPAAFPSASAAASRCPPPDAGAIPARITQRVFRARKKAVHMDWRSA